MLGSHNSFSYLKPTKWWMRLLTPWSKCQDKTIEEQYNDGVRYFDIRIAFKKDGSMRIVHNLIEYPTKELYNALRTFKNRSDVYLRIVLDMRKKPKEIKDAAKLISWFYDFLNYVMMNTEMTIDKAIVFWDWRYIINRGLKVTEWHASVCAKWYQYIDGLKFWAWEHNTEVLTTNTLKDNEEVLLIDFV